LPVATAAAVATTAAVAAAALLFPGCPAVRTAPGLIGETLGSEELLLTSVESESYAAIRAS
jgi:hypothetical protein